MYKPSSSFLLISNPKIQPSKNMSIQALDNKCLMEILSLLSVSCLARMICVCKSWSDLISSPAFHRKLSHSIATHGFLVRRASSINYIRLPSHEIKAVDSILGSSLASIPHYPNIKIVDTCNGLVFYHTYYYPDLNNIYNFARRKNIVLPPDVGACEIAGLAFDPSTSRHFKVVFISRNNGRHPDRRTWIYSSKKGKLYTLELQEKILNALSLLSFPSKKPVFAGGALYFEAYFRKTCILRFDIEKESFDVVELDPKMIGESEKLSVGERKGELRYAEFDPSACEVNIWKLDTTRGTWTHIISGSISLDSPNKLVKIELLHPDDEHVVLIRASDKVLTCNLCTKDSRILWEDAHPNAFGIEGGIFPMRPCFLQSFPKPSRW